MKQTLRDFLCPQPKSKIKAGDGQLKGAYNFYTSSQIQSKFYHSATYTQPALIFGTGGMASIHYCNEPFSTSTDCLVMYGCQGAPLELIYYYLRNNMHLLQDGFKGAGLQHISKDYILNINIDMPAPSLQGQITHQMRLIDAIINGKKQQILSFDEAVKSRFVELFGDMFLNSKAWKKQALDSLADVVSGITKGRKTKEPHLIEVPYMAVSNVKDGYIDWTTVKTIQATKQEIEQYRLLPNDVLMTEGGDPDKLGRGAILKEPLQNCIHQNHIFRVRLNESLVLPAFFEEYLKHQKAKRYFLGCAKQTTGIASINMRQLKALPVLLPPLELQEQFAAFVKQTDKSKLAVQKSLEELEILKKSLMQQYFG